MLICLTWLIFTHKLSFAGINLSSGVCRGRVGGGGVTDPPFPNQIFLFDAKLLALIWLPIIIY